MRLNFIQCKNIIDVQTEMTEERKDQDETKNQIIASNQCVGYMLWAIRAKIRGENIPRLNGKNVSLLF